MRLRLAIDSFDIGPVPLEVRRPPARRWLWTSAAAAAVLVVALTGWRAGLWLRPEPLSQLAALYSANRTMEVRIAGAKYGPVRVSRGGTAGALPAEGHDVAARILRRLEQAPSDPEALHARGRLYLLEGKVRDSLADLLASRDLGTWRATLEIDLADAYYLRFRQSQNAADLTLGIDILSKVIQREPANAAALFNRAVLEEELSLFLPAAEDLEKAIAAEPSEAWRIEMRERLERVKAKTRARLERDPAEDAKFPEVALDRALAAGLAHRDASLDSLAAKLSETHKDAWLRDLLALPRSTANDNAIRSLAAMSSVRLTSDIGSYPAANPEFDRIVPGTLPLPLAKWWQLELLYRTTHLLEKYSCKSALDSTERIPAAPQDPWIEIQIERERAACHFWLGESATAMNMVAAAAERSARHGYDISHARFVGALAVLKSREGNYRQAIGLAHIELLAQLRSGIPIARSHELYNIIMTASARSGRLHAARRAARMTAEVAKTAGFPNLYFTNLSYWAELSRRCGEDGEAGAAYRRAMRAYDESGGKVTSPGWRAWAELGLAEVSGDTSRVQPFEAVLADSTDPRLRATYQLAKASFEMHSGQREDGRIRLEGLLDNLLTNWRADILGIWPDQLRVAGDLLIEMHLQAGRIPEAYAVLSRLRFPSDEPRVGAPRTMELTLAALRPGIGVWRSVSHGIEFRWSDIKTDEYDALVRRLRRLVSSPASNPDEISKVAARLGQGLFGGWLNEVAGDLSVILRSDDRLITLPAGLLPAGGVPLALAAPFALRLPGKSKASASSDSGYLLIVDATRAPIPEDSGLSPLPDAAAEIQAAQGAFKKALVLQGRDASPDGLQRALPGAAALHFAGHTLAGPNRFSFVLAPDGAHDGLLDLPSSTRMPPLVVLSACATAQAGQDEFDQTEPSSLAGAFLARGSTEVLASLWNVDSDAAARLMQAFYSQLNGNSATGEALRLAQRALAADVRFRHPYYWAPYARFIN